MRCFGIRPSNNNMAFEFFGAGNETRTRDPDLGKVVLYQLSYSRVAWVLLDTFFIHHAT
ncbi:hypothetical protein SPRA44_70029 [Serratia proteamaculans]|nr:hypothetical protein SPRA44_70029 [Serratia proteamaculans]